MTYAKLHAEMLASSIWSESDTTRLVWVTMLMLSDRDGMVRASLTGLAHQARVSVEACTAALKTLTGPDPESRDRTTGERVVEVVGGYQLINYEHYRDLASPEDKREKARLRQQRKRDRDRKCHAASRTVTRITPSGSGSGSGSAQIQKRAVARPASVSEEVWEAFLGVRRSKRAKLTEIALAAIQREATKAGLTLEAALQKCAERNWQTFEADWVKPGVCGKHAKPVEHVRNMPLGTPGCQCAECIAFRAKAARSVNGDVRAHGKVRSS